MFFCPDCHVSNRADAKFCRKCGKSRSDLERAEVAVALVIPDQTIADRRAADTSGANPDSGLPYSNPAAVNFVSDAADSESDTADSGSDTADFVFDTADSVSGAADSVSDTADSVSDAADSVSGASDSVSDAADLTAEEVDRDEDNFGHGVATDAPQLSINIEQEESLSAPPDLNTPECPSCWKTLRATDKFCCWCGEAQPNRVLPFLKLCLECSTFLPEKANYCYSCGTDVGYSSRRKVRVPHELFKDEDSEFFPRFDA